MNILGKLNQICTYWEQNGQDVFGKGSFNAPQQLKCRWENIGELLIDKHAQEVVSKARIFLAEGVSLEGYLFLGASTETDPTVVQGAYEVIQVKSSPDIRALQTLYVAYL